jgi:hypothetical protein
MLIELLALELTERGFYTNGVYVFKLKELYKKIQGQNEMYDREVNISLTDLFTEDIWPGFEEDNYFNKNHNMLIILDEYDIISDTEKYKMAPPSLLFKRIADSVCPKAKFFYRFNGKQFLGRKIWS